MSPGQARPGSSRSHGGLRIRHTERREYTLVDQLAPGLARGGGAGPSRGQVLEVAIVKTFAKWSERLGPGRLMENLIGR